MRLHLSRTKWLEKLACHISIDFFFCVSSYVRRHRLMFMDFHVPHDVKINGWPDVYMSLCNNNYRKIMTCHEEEREWIFIVFRSENIIRFLFCVFI